MRKITVKFSSDRELSDYLRLKTYLLGLNHTKEPKPLVEKMAVEQQLTARCA
ncbi:MAG: hypothetical protein L3J57_16040 [Desulfuromusa sp.]|nr:hypothetical protein [Desulfuromusa sp.]